MRVLLVHPGASWSTADVWSGILPALERAGVEVVQYALDGRIQHAGGWLTWIYKRNKGATPKPTPQDILYQAGVGMIERALRHQVDWVLCVSAMYVHAEAQVLLRRAGVKLASIFTESPYDDEWQLQYAKLCNVCWVNERLSVEKFRAVNPNTFYWQHAYDPARHHPATEPDAIEVPAHDVVFVGTGWQERVELLAGVDWSGIDFGLYGAWKLLGSRHPLRRHLRGGITPNPITAALYRKAKIGLNPHRLSVGWGRNVPRVEAAESMNPRCYELAACGTFFATDDRAEVREVFGDLIPTYRTPGELEALIRRYLADDALRTAAAARLPEAVRGHTFDDRVREMLDILKVR